MYGDWFDYNLGWWQHRHDSNVQVFYFEHMKQDLAREVRRVAEVLGVTLGPEEVQDICQKSTFDAMKKTFEAPRPGFKGPVDNKISPFMRKGAVGDWKNHFSEDLNTEVEELYERNMKDVEDPPQFLLTLEWVTVETLYNTINFCSSTHKRHSIARPKGRGMGCLLWVQRATYCVDLSKLSSIKYLL